MLLYTGNNTRHTLSPALWKDFPFANVAEFPQDAWFVFEDFCAVPPAIASTGTWGKFKIYLGANSSMAVSTGTPAVPGGAVRLTIGANNEQVSAFAFPGTLSLAHGTPFWYETRCAVTSVGSNRGQIFFGIGEVDAMTQGSGVPLADNDGCTNTGAMIGFASLEDDERKLRAVYSDRSTSWTTVLSITDGLTANTYIKLGLLYDPLERRIIYHVNGSPVAQVPKSTLNSLTYLPAGYLAPLWAAYGDSSGTGLVVAVAWVAWGQVRPD